MQLFLYIIFEQNSKIKNILNMDIFGISSYPKKYRRGGTFNMSVKARKGARNQACCRIEVLTAEK